MRILYIAYPLLTVSSESAGGAEQVLRTLEQEMLRRGVDTTVAASLGSTVAGKLLPTGDASCCLDDFERRNSEHQQKIIEWTRQRAPAGLRTDLGIDLIHDMSGSFWSRAAELDLPILATLHLPRHVYPAKFFENVPENVRFNCVSHSQARTFTDLQALEGVVANGIVVEEFAAKPAHRSGLLWLGRICEEKAPHLALEIAMRAGMSITIAGQVYPFSYHRQYFDREVGSRLRRMTNTKFVLSPSPAIKRRLLREAKAVLITSQVEETSSLVAMEAAASGTPVIAFALGALPEVVQDGVTGFVVNDMEEAIRALSRLDEISQESCVRHARAHYSSAKMVDAYARIYAQMGQGQVWKDDIQDGFSRPKIQAQIR